VITTKGILDFDEATRRMRLVATLPGETVASVKEATGFELLVARDVREYEPPTVEEVRLIREAIDPKGY
jgi:glutaconate CoA-transferase subunit B